MDTEYVFNRGERQQRYKGKQNFKNALRIGYIKEKKERQRENQRLRDLKKNMSPKLKKNPYESDSDWDESPQKNYIPSTRCK